MSLTAKDVEEIMKLLEESQFDRLNLEIDGVRIELARSGAGPKAKRKATPKSTPAMPKSPAKKLRHSHEQGLAEVISPLLGIFYRAPKPGEPPFVDIGSKVTETSVIGIIEVMKLMNSARAGVAGEVVEILATNGELVEHGEVLMLVRPE